MMAGNSFLPAITLPSGRLSAAAIVVLGKVTGTAYTSRLA